MKNLHRYRLLIVSLILFVVAFIFEYQLLREHPEIRLVEEFQQQLIEQEQLLDFELNKIQSLIAQEDFSANFQAELSSHTFQYRDGNLGFLVFNGAELLYWSSNHFSFVGQFPFEMMESGLVELPNGSYYTKAIDASGYTLIGLIHIKNNYSIQNQFVRNNFVKPFRLPESFKILEKKYQQAIPVENLKGNYLFSIYPGGEIHCNYSQLIFPVIIFILAILVLFFYARKLMKDYRHEHFLLRIFILALSLFGVYWIHLIFRLPLSFYAFQLFSPSVFAYSFWIPSLGDFLLLTSLIFFWGLNFVKEFKYSPRKQEKEFQSSIVFVGALYLFVNYLVQNLILNSSISLELNRIGDIDIYSVIALFIIALLFISIFLINLKILESSTKIFNHRWFLRGHVAGLIIIIILSILFRNTYLYVCCLFLTTNLSVVSLQNTKLKKYSFSYLIYFVSLFAFFSLIIIQHNNESRKLEIQELMAVTLNSEHDPAAEVFLKEMQQEMNVDSIIPFLLNEPYETLDSYLNDRYFRGTGYFQKYDIQVTACAGLDSLLVQPDNQMVPCFPFFDEMIDQYGTLIPGTNFYYLDNMNGRISYFGKLFYPLVSDSIGVSVYLEFNSRLLPEGAGFPELLLDNSMRRPERYQHFSYAKYFDHGLVHLSGDYQYNYYIDSYDFSMGDSEFSFAKWDGFNHLIYRLSKDNYILVSSRSFEFLDYLISFPYLFVFYFLIILLLIFIGNPSYRKQAIIYDLRFKIQASIIAVVLGALLVVAVGTIFYNIQEYESKHQHDLNEKMKSIAEEIDNRLNDVDSITAKWQNWLLHELNKLSNIFRTDIIIYGVDGDMIASSRPEIFRRGIISYRINAEAYYELVENYQVSYYQPERIGNLRYSSIYEPIINNNGDYLGFINLPYFTNGDKLKQEISTFIVAFINLYVLLFLAGVIVAVFLANQITRPLSLIRDKLGGIQLDKKNEQISYHRDDEIGSLVKEYNRKVEELAESAELLARSERELAWREMAKQVAHEIKNPLTPMKLNIQYLQRAKEENNELYDEYFDRVTRTLIEQIDTLSGIATEFSNFAKIPKANNEVFDLCEKLTKVVGLFESNQHINLSVDLPDENILMIFADREQISRAILNLIKNAIQSIPQDRKGEISVSLKNDEGYAVVTVTDNGKGIPEAIRQQMFQPNFTTKSSGMGLGLAIVKKIIENSHGRIWYDTEIDQGTSFYFEIPLHVDGED